MVSGAKISKNCNHQDRRHSINTRTQLIFARLCHSNGQPSEQRREHGIETSVKLYAAVGARAWECVCDVRTRMGNNKRWHLSEFDSATPAFVNRPYETIYRIGINGNYNSNSHTRTTLWYNVTQAKLMRLGYRLPHNWNVTATMGLGHSRKWHVLHIVMRPIDITTIKWIWCVAHRTRTFNNRISINSILCYVLFIDNM